MTDGRDGQTRKVLVSFLICHSERRGDSPQSGLDVLAKFTVEGPTITIDTLREGRGQWHGRRK